MPIKRKPILSVLCFFILLLSSLNGQDISFKRYTVEDGLSQSWVRCILQDSEGFMWFGTSDGLNKFDGYNFKIYRYKSGEKSGLTDVTINFIYEDAKKDLWIGTSKGINILKAGTEEIEYFENLPEKEYRCILHDSNGNYWFGTTDGVIFYNTLAKTFRIFKRKENSIASNFIFTIFEDNDKNIWVGSRDGLCLIKSDTSVTSYYNQCSSFLPNIEVWSIVQYKPGEIIIGAAGQGAFNLKYGGNNPENGKLTRIYAKGVISMHLDKRNSLWIGHGGGHGLSVADLNTFDGKTFKTLNYFKNDPDDENSLSDNSVSSIYEDKWGDIWIGTYGKGLNYFNRRTKKFETFRQNIFSLNTIGINQVNCFFAEDDFLWIGTENGLNRLNKKTGKIELFTHDPGDKGSIGANPIYSIFRDSNKNLWIGTWAGGLNLYDSKTNSFVKFKRDDGTEGNIGANNIFAIFQDSKDNLWVGTLGGGLNLFDYKTKTFKRYLHNSDLTSISDNYVNVIFESKKGNLFISTYKDLNIFNYKDETFLKVDLNPKKDPDFIKANIKVIFQDSRENIWIGTEGGLILYNETSQITKQFTTADGLPNNSIKGILEDDHGNLWLSTNSGLSKFIQAVDNPKNTIFKNYNVSDGLQGNEFNKRAALRDKNGYMYFGGTNGYTRFHPDSIYDNNIIPPVIITEFLVLNKSYPFLKNEKEVPVINLKHSESVVTIKYSSLNYLNPEKNVYAYILEGFEKQWNEVGNQRMVTYTNLSPGEYIFKVKATNNDGIWNNQGASLRIIVSPPWWGTLVFKISAVLFTVILVYALFRLRLRNLREQKKLLEENVKKRTNELSNANFLLNERQEEIISQNNELEKHRNHLEHLVKERTVELEEAIDKAYESDKLKSAFLSNVSHEIRTPMNAIVGFSNLLSDENLDDNEKRKFISYIQSSCESLNVLINDIVEISLIETNQINISKSDFEIDNILSELEDYYKIKNNKDITIQYIRNKKTILCNDPYRFKQIFSNLLNNALKFTDKGFIEFGYNIKNSEVIFYTRDSGIGMDKKEHDKIFDYFYKIENRSKLYSGTGIGLYLCKHYVTLMGGKIWVESEPGKGSSFYFSLPYSGSISDEKNDSEYPTNSMPDWHDMMVIIAEDEPTNYHLMRSILKPTNSVIHWAKNGKEAVDLVKKFVNEKPIVLMDVKMPLMNGDEACKIIKAFNKDIKVVAVTAYAFQTEKDAIKQSGFDVFITKPINQKFLINTLRNLVFEIRKKR